MARLHVVVFALAAVAGAAEDRREPVSVGGFALRPLAQWTFADDRIEVHPKALLGVAWDSNVFGRSDDEVSDTSLRQLAGVLTRWHAGRMHEFDLDLEIDRRTYLEESDLDLTGGRASASWRREAVRSTIGARADFSRDDTPLIESGEQIARDEAHAEVSGGWRASAMRYDAVIAVDRQDYRSDSRFFTADQRDALRPSLTVGVGFVTARDSEWFTSLRLDRIAYASDERFQDSDGARLVLGYRGRLAARARFSAEAGVDHRQYRANAVADDATVTRPALEAGVRWPWETGSAIGLRVFSEVEDSISGGAAWGTGVAADARYRMRVNAALLASAEYLRIEPEDDVAGSDARARATLRARAGGEYLLREGVGLRLLATWLDGRRPDDEDFTRTAVELALAVAF